jgi:hypothetical protein
MFGPPVADRRPSTRRGLDLNTVLLRAGEVDDRRLRTTKSTCGVTPHLDLSERCGQRVVDQELPGEAVANAEQFLQDLGRL